MKKILLVGILLLGMSLSLNASDFEKYKKDCDGGEAKGCSNLGLMYLGGKV